MNFVVVSSGSCIACVLGRGRGEPLREPSSHSSLAASNEIVKKEKLALLLRLRSAGRCVFNESWRPWGLSQPPKIISGRSLVPLERLGFGLRNPGSARVRSRFSSHELPVWSYVGQRKLKNRLPCPIPVKTLDQHAARIRHRKTVDITHLKMYFSPQRGKNKLICNVFHIGSGAGFVKTLN